MIVEIAGLYDCECLAYNHTISAATQSPPPSSPLFKLQVTSHQLHILITILITVLHF